MAEQAGSIKYTVETDTSSQLKAEKIVDKTTTSMANDFKKVDKATKKTGLEVTKTAKAIDKALISQTKSAERAAIAAEKEALRKAIAAEKSAEREINAAKKAELGKSIAAEKSAERAIKAAKKAELEVQAASERTTRAIINNQKRQTLAMQKQLAKRGRATGQVGIQIQQLVGQIQGGQNVMQAFSAQVADIGIVTGFAMTGVIAALAFAIAGPFVTAMGLGVDSTEKLDKAIENLDKTVQDKSGVKIYTKAIADLAKESESAARLMVLAAENSAKDAGKAAAIAIGESFNDSFDVAFFQRSFDALKNIAGTSLGVGFTISKTYEDLGKQFGLTGKKAREAGISVLVSLREMQQAISSDMPDAGAKILAFQEKLAELASTAGVGNAKLLGFVTSINEYILKAKKAAEMSAFLKQTLKDVGGSMPTEETIKQKETIDSLVKSIELQIFALKNSEEAVFRFATAQQLGLKVGEQIPDNIDLQIAALFRLKKAQEEAKEIETTKERLVSQVSSLGLSSEEKLIERFKRENDLLRQAKEQQLLTEQEFLSRSEELEKQHQDKLKGFRTKTNKDTILNFEALENQVIGTFAAIVSGAQDGKTAIRSLAQAVLTQMIGALIKMGIQSLVGQTAMTTATSASMAVIATAAAPAAALVSLATAGANAAPAALGISSTVALSQGLALSGGLEHGGPAQAGKLYQVGEGGKPEIFTSGNKNFMIPGDNGRVISNDDAFGNQTFNQTVIIENNASNNIVSTQTSEDGKQLRVIINEVANQINSNQGVIARALRTGTNTTFKANR